MWTISEYFKSFSLNILHYSTDKNNLRFWMTWFHFCMNSFFNCSTNLFFNVKARHVLCSRKVTSVHAETLKWDSCISDLRHVFGSCAHEWKELDSAQLENYLLIHNYFAQISYWWMMVNFSRAQQSHLISRTYIDGSEKIITLLYSLDSKTA